MSNVAEAGNQLTETSFRGGPGKPPVRAGMGAIACADALCTNVLLDFLVPEVLHGFLKEPPSKLKGSAEATQIAQTVVGCTHAADLAS